MGCNSKNKKNKSKSSVNPAVNNDQLGENASEEYKSEDYTNASQRVKK
ncbi:MAG: hypothetical protein GX066_04720 [Clostridiaceae bacterium]|nr:hypothetical protein [Clostridiaceae bacterium]